MVRFVVVCFSYLLFGIRPCPLGSSEVYLSIYLSIIVLVPPEGLNVWYNYIYHSNSI